MSVDDTTGSVTIYSRGRSGLFADDQGVIVREPRRARRFAWADIKHFADGNIGAGQSGNVWALDIVLNTGDTVRVNCTSGSANKTLPAIRQVAARYGIPAELTGIMMKDGRPTGKGLFEDPGGQDGVRYWDGTSWSPLLAPFLREKEWFVGVRASAPLWAGLPVADEPWEYPAIRAARAKAWTIACSVVIAALLVAGLTIGLVQHSGDAFWAFFWIAANVLWGLIPAAVTWRYWRLVKRAGGPLDSMTTDDAGTADLGSLLAEDGGTVFEAAGLQQSSKALGYVLVAAVVTCALVPAAVLAAGFIYRSLPPGNAAAGMVVGFLPVIMAVVTRVKPKRRAVARLIRLTDSLGAAGRRVLRAGTIVASIIAFFLLLAITPGDWTTG